MRPRYLIFSITVALCALLVPTFAKRAVAMPTFAQAYGLDCKVCHTEVPALNSYGRYVQRNMYGVLDPDQYRHTVTPLWVGWTVTYDSTASSPNVQPGNVEAHAVGFIGADWSYHVQQWAVQGGDTGGLDTMWISYNRLFKGNGHIVLGKMPPAGPSWYGFWNDVGGFAAPSITIGEHAQLLTANRWGGKFAYSTDKWVAEAGYYGSTAGLNGASDWSANNDKGAQWRVAYAPAKHPLEIGLVGNTGTFPLAEGGIDRYSAIAGYAQADPTPHLPGALVYYQVGNDSNPVAAGNGARSKAYTAEVFFPILGRRETMLGLRREMTDDGLGTITHSANVDLSFRIVKYVHAAVEAGLTNGTTPAWRAYVWWTNPLTQTHGPEGHYW